METSASLLERLRAGGEEAASRRLDDLHRPLLRRWLARDPSLGDEVEHIAVLIAKSRVLNSLRREAEGLID